MCTSEKEQLYLLLLIFMITLIFFLNIKVLTHWGWVTHLSVSKLDHRWFRQWLGDAGLLSIGTLGTYLSEILIVMQSFSLTKTHLKMSSGIWRPFCFYLNELIVSSFLLGSRYQFIHIFQCNDFPLTHWVRDKMVSIFHTFSNVFSWMKMYTFRLILHWNLFLSVQLTILQHWLR